MPDDPGGPAPHEEAGDPVMELAGLRPSVPADLEHRVLAAVRRRETVAYSMGFAWGALAALLRAILDALGGVLDHDHEREGEP